MADRRMNHRHRLSKCAKLFTGVSTILNCVVTDISEAGARVEGIQSDALPEHVVLTLDGGRTLRPSRLAWASSTAIGLAFKSTVEFARVPAHLLD